MIYARKVNVRASHNPARFETAHLAAGTRSRRPRPHGSVRVDALPGERSRARNERARARVPVPRCRRTALD